MNNFILENGTKVIFGKGCVKEYLACFLNKYRENVMLAYGGNSIKQNGVYDEIINVLKSGEKEIVEFSCIPANPTYAKVQEGARLAKENNVDVILAVGGGSVMDCCKAVSMAARYGRDLWESFWKKPGVIDFEPLPLCAVVTAAGSGSAMHGGAVITNEEQKIKIWRDYPECAPKLALMDPSYTLSVPAEQMISGGFDTLCHIMESYFSKPDEPNVSDDIAEALMRGVLRDLRAFSQNPADYTARSNLMWEAAMAENRIIKLGKKTDVEGHALKAGKKKLARFATEVLGLAKEEKNEEELAKEGIQTLIDFTEENGLLYEEVFAIFKE